MNFLARLFGGRQKTVDDRELTEAFLEWEKSIIIQKKEIERMGNKPIKESRTERLIRYNRSTNLSPFEGDKDSMAMRKFLAENKIFQK